MTMLDRMRRHRAWLKWSLGIVVATFVFLYVPQFLRDSSVTAANDAIASVNGRPITTNAYRQLYLQQVSLLEAELQRGFPDRNDMHSVALAIGALTYGVITRRLRGWSGSSLEDDIESVVRFAWLGVAGR